MQLGNYGLTVLVGGRPAREYGHDGRTFVAGQTGREYTVRLSNRSHRRVKAVVSVDGVNAIDGRGGKDGSGYVIDPWTTLDVPGWRLCDLTVAKFAFADPDQSYAGVSGRGENVGVVAAAFYEEDLPAASPAVVAQSPAPTGPALSRVGTAATARAGSLGGSLGTAFGAKADHAVRKVEFVPRPRPAAVVEVRYEDAAILRGLGVDADDEAAGVQAAADAGYCPPPKNWRG